MSDETELIKERLDIADVIAEYVQLRRAGQHFKGLCPFHQEKSPSFVVSPEKGIWHCFGCGEGGDVFTFVSKIEGLDFVGTLKMLADRAGVELKKRTSAEPSNARARLYEVLELTARLYHEILVNQAAGKPAITYLTERGMTEQTIRDFQIGYAPQQWQTAYNWLKRKGYTDAEQLTAGIIGKNEGGKIYDRFRGRIIFPIQDVQGRIVAFGGRIAPWHATGNEGKYVNSPETLVYEKRRTVYNLNRAKQSIREQRSAIVVEGYMDVVLLVQSGITNVVASSGTAFTAEHLQQLRRFTTNLHFAFDSDSAGLHAAISATATALNAGLRVDTIVFPAGQDPADVALKDPKKLQTYIDTPQPLVVVLLKELARTASGEAREELLPDVLSLIKSTTNVVLQGEMIQAVAKELHVDENIIIDRIRRIKVAPAPLTATVVTPSPTIVTASNYALSPEHLLLGLVILEPSVRSTLLTQLTPANFEAEATKNLFAALREAVLQPTGTTAQPAELLGLLPADHLPLAEALRQVCQEVRVNSSQTPLQEGEQLVRALQRKTLEQQLRALQQQLVDVADLSQHTEELRHFQAVAEALAKVKGQG